MVNTMRKCDKPEPSKCKKDATVMGQRSRHYKRYITSTLPKCYDPPPRRSQILNEYSMKKGFRRYYFSKDLGLLYRGRWKDNLRHGFGTQVNDATNEIYEGNFQNDQRNGYGVISHKKPTGVQMLLYEGTLKKGKPNGEGELHTDTYHYKGHVVDGKASGAGFAWFKDGTFYFGSWYDGKRMGLGMLVYKNRTRFEGNWYNDRKHGFGQHCFFDRGQALEGIWVNDVCVTGTIRNIKNRQGAINPVKYPIPKLMLKDWATTYLSWEKEAFARAGRYVKLELGLPVDEESKQKESTDTEDSCSSMEETNLEPWIELISREESIADHDSKITHVQPCLIFS